MIILEQLLIVPVVFIAVFFFFLFIVSDFNFSRFKDGLLISTGMGGDKNGK